MTARFHVATDPTDRLSFNGKHYTVASWKGGVVGLRRTDNPDLVERFDAETMRAVWEQSDFRHDRFFYSDSGATGRGIVPAPSIATLNERDRGLTLYRLAYVENFLRLLANRKGGYKRTYESARQAATAIRPIVDALGHFVPDEDHRIGIEGKKRKGRVGRPLLVDGKPQIEGSNEPCGETLMRWLWAFQKAGGDPMSLKPAYANSGYFGSHLAPEVEALITKHLHGYYLQLTRPTPAMFLEKVVRSAEALNAERLADGEPKLVLPGRAAIDHAINGIGKHYADTKRYGKDYADKAHPWNGDGLDIRVPGQRVEIDAYECDVLTLMTWSGFWEGLTRKQRRALKKHRMWLTVAIDRATRVVLGMKLSSTPDVPSAIATLEMIESDKTRYSIGAETTSSWHHRTGTMTVVADGGYVDHRLRAAMADARGTIEYPQANDPKMRAVVERLFRSVAETLMARLHGKTFSDIFKRADYDSVGNAGWTVDELAWLMITWVVDIYHNSPHQGLGHRTPNQAWDEAVEQFGVHPWRDAHARRSAFGTRLKRKLTGNGFEVLGNRYQDDDPNGLRHLYLAASGSADREFEILFDQSNMGAISVVVDEVAIEVPNRDPFMQGVRASDMIEAAVSVRSEQGIRNRLPMQIAHDAIRRIEERNERAGFRSSIAQKVLDSQQIDHAEKEHFGDFLFAFEPEVTESAVLGNAVSPFDGEMFVTDDEAVPNEGDPMSGGQTASGDHPKDGTANDAEDDDADDWSMDD